MVDPDRAKRERAETIIQIVRDPRAWGMGREFEIGDVFEVWAGADHR